MKQFILSLFLSLICIHNVFSNVDTRLTYVSNSSNKAWLGKGTLIFDVEAVSSDGNSQNIHVFQNAIQLDETFRNRSIQVRFSESPFGNTNYTATQDYQKNSGRIRFLYTYDSGTPVEIGTEWTRIVRISIEYDIEPVNGAIQWYERIPNYMVTDQSDTDITGIETVISAALNQIDLEANQPPIVDAGPDTTITLGDTLVLTGYVDDDGLPLDPGETVVVWSKQSGPGTVIFNHPNSATTTAVFPEAWTYVLRITASDGEAQVYDEIEVTVKEPVQGGDIVIDTNTTWESGEYTYNSVWVTNNATLTLNGSVTLNCMDLVIDAGASISADETGYAGGQPGENGEGYGYGVSSYDGNNGIYLGTGGGYGGMGGSLKQNNGFGVSISGGNDYGCRTIPVLQGSGGAGGGEPAMDIIHPGGNGGGAIFLNISGNLTVEGDITSNGGIGTFNFSDSYWGGGGSGGSICIIANTISGNGNIQANGGGYFDPENLPSEEYFMFSGGGGGRISVYFYQYSFNGAIEAKGGYGLTDSSLDPPMSNWGINGSVVVTSLASETDLTDAGLTFANMNQTCTETHSYSADILSRKGAIDNIEIIIELPGYGVLNNTFLQELFDTYLDSASFDWVDFLTPPFKDTGFFKCYGSVSNFNYGDPVMVSGSWNGMITNEPDSDWFNIRGQLSGGLVGIAYGKIWLNSQDQCEYEITAEVIKVVASGAGAENVNSVVQGYFGDQYRVVVKASGYMHNYHENQYTVGIQTTQSIYEGRSKGYYSDPVSVITNQVQVMDGAPYIGEGFAYSTYQTRLGSGEQWLFCKEFESVYTCYEGLASGPLSGAASALLDESEILPVFYFTSERINYYFNSPIAEFDINLIGQPHIDPSALDTVNLAIEVRNQGVVAGSNEILVCEVPWPMQYTDLCGEGSYDAASRKIFLNLDMDPRTLTGLTLSEQLVATLPEMETVDHWVYILDEETDLEFNPLLEIGAEIFINNPDFLDMNLILNDTEYEDSCSARVKLNIQTVTIQNLPSMDFSVETDSALISGQYYEVINGSLSQVNYDVCIGIDDFYTMSGLIGVEDLLSPAMEIYRDVADIETLSALELLDEERVELLSHYIISKLICQAVPVVLEQEEFQVVMPMQAIQALSGWSQFCFEGILVQDDNGYRSDIVQALREMRQNNAIQFTSFSNQLTTTPNVNMKTASVSAEGIEYTIQYGNAFDEQISEVCITDVLDDHINVNTLVINDGGIYLYDTRTIVWFAGDLDAQAYGSVSFSAGIVENSPYTNQVANYATICFQSKGCNFSTNPVVSAFDMQQTYQKEHVITHVESIQQPTCFELKQNYPNPFNPSTRIEFQLAEQTDVRIKVYNIVGQEVTTLVQEELDAGYHTVDWHGINQSGAMVASGIYFIRMDAGDYSKTLKMMLLR